MNTLEEAHTENCCSKIDLSDINLSGIVDTHKRKVTLNNTIRGKNGN